MAAQRITLIRTDDGWLALHTDPQVVDSFGTGLLPTAFGPSAQPETVLKEIRRLNPEVDVELGDWRDISPELVVIGLRSFDIATCINCDLFFEGQPGGLCPDCSEGR